MYIMFAGPCIFAFFGAAVCVLSWWCLPAIILRRYCFLNPDIIPEPEALASLMKLCLEREKEHACIWFYFINKVDLMKCLSFSELKVLSTRFFSRGNSEQNIILLILKLTLTSYEY